MSASHMFPSGYVGMSSATTAAAGSASASSSVSHSGSSHNMPVAASSSSSSVHHHYSASALATSSVNNPASVAAAATGSSGSSYAAVAASTRSRMYDLDMLTPQQQQQQHSQHTAHSMLSSNSSTGRSSGFDVYSHNSLYAQQQQSQRHHSAASSTSHHPHHMAATHHSLHSSHHHTPHHSQQQHHQQQQQHSTSGTSLHHQHHGTHQQTQPTPSSSHSLHHHHQQQQQHYYHHQHHHTPQQTATSLHRSHNTQVMGPMLQHIKSEPVEQITVTPSIQTEEVIIKSEPVDDSGYHKSAPQIENNTFHMDEKRKQQQQHEYQQKQLLQQQQQQQQQQQHQKQQQQQLHEQQQQRVQQQKLHEQQKQQQQQQQQQQIQIKQEPHDYPQHHHHHQHPQQHRHQHHQHEEHKQQSEYTHNEVLTQQTQKSLNSENSTTIEKTEQKPEQTQQQTSQQQSTLAAAAAAAAEQQQQLQSQQISLTNIKTEAKPLNFPRRKLQTERSSTLPICQRCKQVFLKRQNYTQHVALSSCNIVEYDFKCSVCPMSFMSNEELQTHEQLHRSHRYFCQKYCGKFYETIEECEQHEYGQHEYEMYKCNICCISVTQRDQLFTHLQEHKYQPRFDCCICRLCFHTSLELHDHYMGNEDFCGKFYDKEAFKKPITSLATPYLGKPESSNLEISHTFSLKDIPPANSQHLEPLYKKPTTSKTSMEPPNTTTSSKSFGLEPPEFALEPQVEVKTEIKVEPDFYPPMDQSDYGNYDQDYNTNDYNSTASSNQNLAFLHDYQDNASSSTNSSFSFNNNNDAIQEEDAMCCVPKCGVSKYSAPSLQFFGFPRDEKYLSQWLHNLKMVYDPNVNYGAYRICSLHFPKRCIAKYSLSYWAVPTFNLGHDDVGNLYQNRESSGGFPGGEMAKCSMPGCPSQRGETNVKFHVFPRDLKTLIKWCQNSRLPVHSKDNRFFCSRHFEEKCFGKFRLKPWAIPTLNLGTVYGKIHDNPNIYQEEKKCFLPFCRRSRSYDCNLSLYRFPRDETLLRRWCYNLRLDPNMYRGKNHKICSSHFIKEALGLRKLNPGAVPTLNLGHNDRFNIYENELYTPPPPPPPPPQHHSSTSSKAHKFERMFKQEIGSGSRIYDNVFMGSMVQKYSSSSSSSNSGNNLDLGDVCLVPTCKRTRHSADITLHTVPKRPEQLKKWCHNLKMNLEKMHKSVRICSAHFEKYCIGGCMRPFAVPTLELGHDDPNIYRNPDVIKKLNIRETCCVQSCKRNRDRDHANLHRFPTHPELLQKWCENLQKPIPDGSKLFNDAVCEIHFEERCLRNKRLEKWAIPTLNLGWDGAPHSLPSEEEINENWVKPFAPNNGDEQGECCVASCKRNPQIDDVKLYRPPEDAEQLNKWAHNLQVDVTELPNLKICNLHFEQHCIGKRLLNWAMPTLNLGAKVEHLFENPPPMPAVYKKKLKPERILSSQEAIKWSPRCCLPHCRKMRSVDKVHLFRFPYNNRQTLAKWCHNLQLPLVGSSHRRICSTHFESSVLTKRCPMSLAVPTLDLNAPPGYKIYQNPARLKQIKPGAQRQCIIESCRKTKLDEVTLYRFPNNRSILYKWRHNIKNWPKGKLSSQLRICGEHFEPHSVSERKLSPGAIPTLNLGHDSKDLYPNETRSFFDLEKCVVNGCDSRKEMEDIRLFRFPRDDEELLKKWCHNLQMNTNDCVGIKICSKHFELECLGPRQLYKWAIPTLKLGHKEDELVDIIPNPPPEQRTGEFLFKCCVPTCGKTRKYDDAQMNSFPKNLKLFRKWKHNLKLDFLNFKEREKYKICNDHFEPICVGKTRLNFGALPTLNLGHDDVEDLYQINPDRIRPNLFIKQKDVERLERRRILREENQEEQQEEYDRGDDQLEENVDPLSLEATDIKCCIEECCAPKSIMREPYDLPESREFKTLWLKEIKSQEEDDFLLEQKICGLHFQALFEKLKDKMQTLSDNNDDLKSDFNKLLFNYQKSLISLVINSYQCRVEHCSSNLLNPSMKLFFFPYGKNLINKWSHNTGIIPDEHRRYMNKVCALHFESYCITENQRLRSWAIPTLKLPFNDADKTLYKNPDLTKLDRRMLGPQILKCAVNNCQSEESVKVFNFPTEDKLLKKWCDNLKISHHLTPLLKICSRHFEKLCFGSCRIRSWAIPTLNLGHDQPPEHLNKFTINKEVYKAPEENSDIQLKQVKIKRSLDSAKCSIPSCRKSRLKHGVRFYSLPSNPKMKRKWLHNLQIKHLKSSSKISQIKICNLHFHKRCLDGKQLKAWAVPTMHLGHSEHIFDNPRRVRSLPVLRCTLPHCKNHASLKGVRAFVFPRSMEYLERWSKNLKLDIDKCKGRLCQEHFEKEVIGNRKLKNGAVPTLNLGHEDEDIYDNSKLKEKLFSKQIDEVKICPDYEIEYEQHSDEDDEEEDEEEHWESELEEEEEEEDPEQQIYYDDDEEDEDDEEEDEEEDENQTRDREERESERNLDDDNISVSNSISDWSSIKFKELRVSITPLTPEDLMDLCSRSSYEREFGSLTPASSLKGRRSITPASSWKDIRSETPEQKTNVFDLNLKSNSENQEQKTFNDFREPRSVTPDQKIENKTEETNNKSALTSENPTNSLLNENKLKREHSESNNEEAKRERLELTEDETSSTSLPNETEFAVLNSSKTNLRTDKALNAVAPICCLKHCGKEKTPEQHLTTYGFPKDPQLLQKWCDNLGLQPEECIGRVCIDHFELRVIGTRRLKLGAVPTLNLGPNQVAKHTNVEETATKKTPTKEFSETNNLQEVEGNLKPPPPYKTPKLGKQSVFRLCCLKHCRRKKFVKPEKREKEKEKEKMPIMFRFPNDKKIKKKWFKNLRLPENLELKQDLEICSRHFEKEVIRNNKLLPGAVPTLELSYANRKPIYKNSIKAIKLKTENREDQKDPEEKREEQEQIQKELKDEQKSEKCFLKHCGKEEQENVFLIAFPLNDPLTLRKWCKNLKLNYEMKSYKNYKICNEHFETYVFYKKRHLRTGALPTLNLGHSDDIIRNCRRLRLKRGNCLKLKEICCLKQCQASNYKLYTFPRNSELRKIWCNNLQLELRQVLNNHLKICKQHFPSESFIVGTDNLKLNAIPVLNLGLQTEQHVVKSATVEESKCLVENCQKTPSVDRVKLFGFPDNPEILKKWLFNLNLSPETFRGNELICSKHFDKSSIKNGQLHENAIPTQFLELSEKSWFYNNTSELYECQKQCCVLNCKQGADQAKHLYRFPKHKEDVDKWLYNLKLPLDDTEVKDLRVCDRHFEQSCKISHKDLITQALPTLNLGHNDSDIYGNNFIKCCLDLCSIEGFYYHKLPEDLMLQSFWFQELEMESSFNNSSYICSVHFVAFFERILEKYSVFLKESKEYVKLSLTYNELKALPALQTYKCHIPKCNSGFKLIWKLFKFPKDHNLFNKWLHNTGLQFDYAQRPLYRLCAQHFEERCLSEKKLHRWSLPTLNLPFNNSLYVNPPEALPPQHENLKHCCVANCVNLKGPFYKFPVKQLDIKKWVHNLELGPQQCTLNLRVCFKHFENYCFAKAKNHIKPLKSWSVPTLKLKRKTDLFLNPSDKIDFYVCCLASCKQRLNRSKDIYLFKFPSSNSLRQKWLHNLNIGREEYKESMRLCSLHFEMDCFYKGFKLLRKHSVPTLGLGANPSLNLYTNPQRRLYLKCCIKVCKNPGQDLLSFPKQKIVLRKWCHNLQLAKEIKCESLRDWKICKQHFENECFNRLGRLRNMAVPTLKLGHRRKIFKNPDFTLNTGSKTSKEKEEVETNKSNIIYKQNEKQEHLQEDENPLVKASGNLLEQEQEDLNPPNNIENTLKSKIKVKNVKSGNALKETKEAENVIPNSEDFSKSPEDEIKETTTSELQNTKQEITLTKSKISGSRNAGRKVQNLENSEECKLLETKIPRTQSEGRKAHKQKNSGKILKGKTKISKPKSRGRKAQQQENSENSKNSGDSPVEPENVKNEFEAKLHKPQDPENLQTDKYDKQEKDLTKSNSVAHKRDKLTQNVKKPLKRKQQKMITNVKGVKSRNAMQKPKATPTHNNNLGSTQETNYQQDQENQGLSGLDDDIALSEVKAKLKAKTLKLRRIKQNSLKLKRITKMSKPKSIKDKITKLKSNSNPPSKTKHLETLKTEKPDETLNFSIRDIETIEDAETLKEDLESRTVEDFKSQPDKRPEDLYLENLLDILTESPENEKHQPQEIIKYETNQDKSQENSENLLQIIRETQDPHDEELCKTSTEENPCFTIYEIKQETIEEVEQRPENNYKEELSDFKTPNVWEQVPPTNEEKDKSIENELFISCGIRTCPNFNNPETKVPLFKLPTLGKLRNQWLENCKLKHCTSSQALLQLKICLEHFEKQCFMDPQRLLLGAMPTLKLGRKLTGKHFLEYYRNLRCSVASCQRSKLYDKVQSIKFPEGELKRKWCLKLGLKEDDINDDSWICHKHFERKCLIEGRKAKEGVIPSLLLTKEEELAGEKGELFKCCVRNCRDEFKPPCFKFPYHQPEIYGKWLRQLKLKDSAFIRTKAYVCSKHFAKQSFQMQSRHLKPKAIPELYLEDQEGEKYKQENTSFKCCYPSCQVESSNLYDWPNKGLFAQLNKKSLNLSIITQTKSDFLKLCSQHFYISYATNEDLINSHKSSKILGDLKAKTKETWEQLLQLPQIYGLKCAVKSCKTDHNLRVNKSTKLFPFPDNELAHKWCHNIELNYATLRQKPEQKVCELHFIQYCIYRRNLWPWAIPTLNLTLHEREIIQNDNQDISRLTGLCCITSCINNKELTSNPNFRFYKFPQDSEMLKKWLDITQCKKFKRNFTRICGLHFNKTDFNKNLTLKTTAMPRYNLDNGETEGIDENIQVKQELDNFEEWPEPEPEPEPDGEDFEKDLKTFDNLESFENAYSICDIQDDIQIKQELDITEDWRAQESQTNMDFSNEEADIKIQVKQEVFEEPNDFDFNVANEKTAPAPTPTPPLSNLIITDIKSQIYLCCVQKCPNNSQTPNIQMFNEFPRDSEIFIKWCFNLKIDPRLYQENQYAICQQHFENVCFDSDNSLHPWAVPTLLLNLNENSFIHQNDIPEHMKPASEQCLVYGCINPLKPLYKFPFKPDLSHKWFANLKLDYTDFRAQNYRICKRHFPQMAFEANDLNRLKSEAVPSLFLGHNDKILYFNAMEDQLVPQQQQQQQEQAEIIINNQDNSRGSSQASLRRLISPHLDLEDHDSSYFEDFEEYYGQED
ncbi:uncharacterized protein ACRADG_005824 isoform 2-T4 [Cochliomyia hominivorax]